MKNKRNDFIPTTPPIIFTKEDLISNLKTTKSLGWIKTKRPGNNGAVGNTLEDLLNIEETDLLDAINDIKSLLVTLKNLRLINFKLMETSIRKYSFCTKIKDNSPKNAFIFKQIL